MITVEWVLGEGKMRLYFFHVRKIRKLALYAVVLAFMVVVSNICSPAVAEVFNEQRELPIYSVDCKEKKLAITFDCAWGAVA